jgi:hypothetical protein
MWSSVMSDPLDELAADPDVISGGGEDFSAFVEGPADLVGPVDAIIRRGRGIRLRRAGMAAGGLGLVAAPWTGPPSTRCR